MTEEAVKRGSLTVVGTGIRVVGQMTVEAIAWIKRADRVLYIVNDPVAEEAIRLLNPAGLESLSGFYAEGKARLTTYHEMVDRIMDCVRSGNVTCLAAYGHPGVFAYPTHESMRRARAEGFPARMLPGISAEDCLFAELGIDPAAYGCQSYEATDYLLNDRTIDPTASVILWQIGLIGEVSYRPRGYNLSPLALLAEKLGRVFRPDQGCVVYEASPYPGIEPSVRSVPILGLPRTNVTPNSTLYIPPSRPPRSDPDMVARIAAMMDGSEGAEARQRPDGRTEGPGASQTLTDLS